MENMNGPLAVQEYIQELIRTKPIYIYIYIYVCMYV